MTDRELLEAAAEAAGIKVVRSRLDDPMNRDLLIEDSPRNMEQAAGPWNPLTDDGDAFRLAVKLKLTINPYQSGVFVSRYEDEAVIAEPFDPNGRNAEITRRAIVRAAAALTPSMESKEE